MQTHELRDGREIQIRPIRPDDKRTIEESWSEISSQARYFRFFRAVEELSQDELRYFTEVDQLNHVALVAIDPTDTTTRSLGVARWIRSTDSPETAEFAVVVIDSYQRIGLGKLFLSYLVRTATARGLSKLRGWIHAENKAMRALFRGIGGELMTQEGPLCCYELTLPATTESLARS